MKGTSKANNCNVINTSVHITSKTNIMYPQLRSLVIATIIFNGLLTSTVYALEKVRDPIHEDSYVALGTIAHPFGIGSGNVGRTHGINPINMDLIGHYDVALSQQGIDPMNVGPNYRLGNILKTEGGPFGPVGGPLNPHIGPYYGLHGHRFHSSKQADSLLSGQSGPLEPSLIPSPVQHPVLTNQYTNPEVLAQKGVGEGYKFAWAGGHGANYGQPMPMTGLGTGMQPFGPYFFPEQSPEVYKAPLGPMPYTPPYPSQHLPLPEPGQPSPFGNDARHVVPIADQLPQGLNIEPYVAGHGVRVHPPVVPAAPVQHQQQQKQMGRK